MLQRLEAVNQLLEGPGRPGVLRNCRDYLSDWREEFEDPQYLCRSVYPEWAQGHQKRLCLPDKASIRKSVSHRSCNQNSTARLPPVPLWVKGRNGDTTERDSAVFQQVSNSSWNRGRKILNSKQNEFETRDDKYIMRPRKLAEGIKTFIWQVHVFSHTQSPIHVVGNQKPSCYELLR